MNVSKVKFKGKERFTLGKDHCCRDTSRAKRFCLTILYDLFIIFIYLAANPKGLGAYNLGSVRPSVHASVDSDFSEVYGSNSLNLYTKIRYGPRIMHV